MVDAPPNDPNDAAAPNWRARYDSVRGRGVPLDPTSEPVRGVVAYPTSYAVDHLLVTVADDALEKLLELLSHAAGDFGWGIELQNLDGTPLEVAAASARAKRARDALDLPTIHRVEIFPQPSADRDDQPVPPIDAWRLLQRVRARYGKDVSGVSLDHVMSVDGFGSTNPFGGMNGFGSTNPFGMNGFGSTNPFGMNGFGSTNAPGPGSYRNPGSGGRQVIDYIGSSPSRTADVAAGGRRPVVAVLDTGCGSHPWLPDSIVQRRPQFDGNPVGVIDDATDPEVFGDLLGAFDGALDPSAGHGTFIAGIVRQVCPEADLIAVRVADGSGTVLEGDLMLAVRSLVKWMAAAPADGGRAIDVINMSLGYYHETPDDELFDHTLAQLLIAARRQGCAVVCSAGNDSTDRPAFPAALWGWPGAEFVVDDPTDTAPHVSVGALNPNRTSVALFSNIGAWVQVYAPGAGVVSTTPPFEGGVQAGTRNDRKGMRRETIDPDDFRGGFAVWSGSSFAAPYVSGLLAAGIAGTLMDGSLGDADARIDALRKIGDELVTTMSGMTQAPAAVSAP